jgi:predicted anti-sigma-YlaC factor YlaD
MNETNCENVLMAKMAEIDGEETTVFSEQINLHLATCENCRQEIEQMQVADNLLKRQVRREQDADLWSAIEKQIGAKTTSQIGWKPFALLGVLLVAYKLLEMLPRQDFGLAFKLVPLVFIVALFVFLKENPFKINAELMPER